jgi:CRISPR/Cas system-associated exonuclease Cas4 (RecB family)
MSSSSRQFGLSKSKITSFEQCPKRLWLQTHRAELAELDAGAEARFAAGHEVGDAACALCPGGVMIEAEPDLAAALQRTQDLISASAQAPLFEATFAHDGVLVRVDIMEPDGLGGWHVAEVKSSTSRKDYHVADLATQLWVLREAGVQVSSAAIRHLNNQFFLTEEGSYHGAFVDTPSLEDAKPLALKRPKLIAEIRSVLGSEEPARDLGDHCYDPFPCEFVAYCSRDLETARYPVSSLPRTGRQLAAKWAEHGIVELEDVPPGSFTNAVHARIHEATLSGIPYHDVEGARRIIGDWAYPRTYLDFETIAFALPRWLGTKPWEQVPFQFSAHIEDRAGQITHREFLSLDGKDPRRACAEALVAQIPEDGTVIAYNAAFERTCILRLAERFSDLAEDLKAIAARIVDLLPVTREHWYHRDQGGSWSIKAVIPTIPTASTYDELDVGDGSAAQMAYLEAINPGTWPKRRQHLEQGLKAYCAKDTFAMIEVLRHLVADACPSGATR